MTTDSDSSMQLSSKKEESFIKKWFSRKFSQNVGEEIQTLIDEREEAGEQLSDDERELIAASLKFGDIDADTICVPRSDIISVPRSASFEEVLNVFKESEFSRLPVHGKDLDEIVGFVTLKDMVRYFGKSHDFELKKAVRACCFVPDSMYLPQVLAEMRKRKVQLAVVVDEYGGTAGLITGKDILEQLIGDIEDENEQPDSKSRIQHLSKGRFRIDPRAEIEELEGQHVELLGADEEGDYDTVSGFILEILGRMPEKGERIELPTGHGLVVNAVDGRRIRQLTFIPNEKKVEDVATTAE